MVSSQHARRMRLADGSGRVHEVSLDALGPQTRLLLLRRTPAGLEPAALWLNEDGLPRTAHGWHHTFTCANNRLRRQGFVGFAGAPHMLRHSFALRWYAVGRLLYEARFAHLTAEETRDFRAQFGNTWDLVQMLLGHRDQRTTKDVYLEPFRSLDMELLFLHAADTAVPEIMATLFEQDRRVLGDPIRPTG
ncbi:MAG: site-specific integrase [Jatrophihabitans sp.]